MGSSLEERNSRSIQIEWRDFASDKTWELFSWVIFLRLNFLIWIKVASFFPYHTELFWGLNRITQGQRVLYAEHSADVSLLPFGEAGSSQAVHPLLSSYCTPGIFCICSVWLYSHIHWRRGRSILSWGNCPGLVPNLGMKEWEALVSPAAACTFRAFIMVEKLTWDRATRQGTSPHTGISFHLHNPLWSQS